MVTHDPHAVKRFQLQGNQGLPITQYVVVISIIMSTSCNAVCFVEQIPPVEAAGFRPPFSAECDSMRLTGVRCMS